VADASVDSEPRDIGAKITDADIERARKQIGIPQRRFVPTFNTVANADAMRHFAYGLVGDDNPLWHDESYARKTRWRGLLAHPLFIQTMGINECPPYPDEIKPLFRGLFRGIGKYLASTTWTFYKPIFQGDSAYEEYTTTAIDVKQSSFSGGRSVIDTYRSLYVDRAGTPLATREHSLVNAERGGSKEKGKYSGIERQTYTPDDIAKIDEMYAAEQRRGDTPRYFEEVEVGEELVPVAKGPLTMVDLICRHIAGGMADGYDIGPLRYGWKARQKIAAFYTPDAWGVPQVQQRVHWDDGRAQDLGLPGGYDYAVMRFAWLSHLLTNWMGDDGWIKTFSVDLRQFNFVGDFHVVSGRVTGKRMEEGQGIVELSLAATNQRGDVTTHGTAEVLLPSRANGAVVLPTSPRELVQRGANMMAEAAERARR
jgi:acyl dehydratase